MIKQIKYFLIFLRLILWNEGILSRIITIASLISPFLIFTISWEYWLLIFLFLLWLQTVLWSYKKWRGELTRNWIEKYKLEHGQYPHLPEYLLPFVGNNSYIRGEPLHKGIKILRPSTQSWERLKEKQEEYLQWQEWNGGDRESLLRSIEDTRPPSGRNKGLKYKR